jgi:hypothetical protein
LPRPRILITGTGRAGTTLLLQLLGDLGLDTGFPPDAPIDDRVHAGLEAPLDDPDGPWIVKSPTAVRRLDDLLTRGVVALEHVIVPMRDLDVAAASRVRNTQYGADLASPGGLLGTRRATHQREALALLQYELVWTLTRHEIPFTTLEFPRFAGDAGYLHRHLGFLAPDVPVERWREAVAARVRPDLIHETPLTRSEQATTLVATAYNGLLVRPARAVRAVVRGGSRSEPGARP